MASEDVGGRSNDGIVYVIDDDDSARHSLEFLLDVAGIRVRSFPSADAFLKSAPPLDGACVVTDVRMPGKSGIELVEELKLREADVPVIVITGHADVPLAIQAMKAGVADFIEKPFDDELLLRTIRAATDTSVARRAQTEREARFARDLARLTAREREVLGHVLASRHNREIAALLDISPRTVEVYKARIMDKLRVDRLPDLIRLALEMGVGKP